MPVTNCICIKFGNLYGPEYVNRLHSGLARHSADQLRFFCMTDDRKGLDPAVEALPLREEPYHSRMFAAMKAKGYRAPFQKIGLFRPDLIPDLDGPLLVFDIDVVIIGAIEPLRDYAPGKIAMRREWHSRPGMRSLGHGSVEKIEPAKHHYLYDTMLQDPVAALEIGKGSEQNYTSELAYKHGDFQPFPDSWVASFKYDCRPNRPFNLFVEPRKPADARVVCFHGRPKMEEAVAGYRAGLSSTRPCGWLAKAWMGQ